LIESHRRASNQCRLRCMQLTSTIQPAIGRDRDVCHQGEREKSLEKSHGCVMRSSNLLFSWRGWVYDGQLSLRWLCRKLVLGNLPLDEMKTMRKRFLGEARKGERAMALLLRRGLYVRTATGNHETEARINHVTQREGALGLSGSGPLCGLPSLFVSSSSIFNDEVLPSLLAGALTEPQKNGRKTGQTR
jgi:hypothetical protein